MEEPIELEYYEQIGNLHNEGLDYILSTLTKESVGGKIPLANTSIVLSIVEEAAKDFTNCYCPYERSVSNCNDFPVQILDFLFKGRSKDENITSQLQQKIILSELQIHYFDRINEVISNINLDLEQSLFELCLIEDDIRAHCSSDEIDILLTSTAVGKSSLEYWSENFDEWANKLVGFPSCKPEDDWEWFWGTLKNMGKSDLVGAGIGAGVGALAGGVGAAPGAVAGGCYSSAGRGIVALLDHWEIW